MIVAKEEEEANVADNNDEHHAAPQPNEQRLAPVPEEHDDDAAFNAKTRPMILLKCSRRRRHFCDTVRPDRRVPIGEMTFGAFFQFEYHLVYLTVQ